MHTINGIHIMQSKPLCRLKLLEVTRKQPNTHINSRRNLAQDAHAINKIALQRKMSSLSVLSNRKFVTAVQKFHMDKFHMDP